jgi:hypothetical protein
MHAFRSAEFLFFPAAQAPWPGGTWKKVTGPYGKKVIQGPLLAKNTKSAQKSFQHADMTPLPPQQGTSLCGDGMPVVRGENMLLTSV